MDYKDGKIKERIEEVMREKGLSQKDLTEQTGICQSSISAILRLQRSPMPLIEKMDVVMGINKTWLLTGGGQKYNISDQSYSKNIANLSIEERAKMINDINQLYKRHQDLLSEASEVMKQIVELNKSLLLSNA